jgi:hypothetical protein
MNQKKSKVTKREVDLQKILSQYNNKSSEFNPELFKSLLEEFLGSFIIIGYTQKGNPISMTNSKTIQETDALNTSLQRYIQNFFSSPPPMDDDHQPDG